VLEPPGEGLGRGLAPPLGSVATHEGATEPRLGLAEELLEAR